MSRVNIEKMELVRNLDVVSMVSIGFNTSCMAIIVQMDVRANKYIGKNRKGNG